MKVTIDHNYTKRQINGPFNLCMSRKDMENLYYVIKRTLENDNFQYGWIYIEEEGVGDSNHTTFKRQNSITNTEPLDWDSTK